MLLTNTGEISSSTAGSGNAGSVMVDVAGLLSIDGSLNGIGSGIFSQAQQGSTGNAGLVSISANSLSLTNGAVISSSTLGPGNAGSVTVGAAGQLSIDGAPSGFSSGVFSATAPGSSGNGGLVTVNAGSLALSNGGEISSSTFGRGNAGSVAIIVPGLVSIDGAPSSITSQANAGSTGSAGQVAITAGGLALTNLGQISSSTVGPGHAGDVSVNVSGPLSIDGASGAAPSGILSTAAIGSTGNAGQVLVTAGSASLSNGGAISTATLGTGNAGTVALTVGGALSLASGGQVTSGTSAAGSGGTVNVTAGGPLSLSDPGTGILASAASAANGNAGSVGVVAPSIALQNGAQIASTMSGLAKGGSVSVSTPGALSLSGAGTQIAASATGPQSLLGGSVMISAGTLSVSEGGQIASSSAGLGDGGDVTIASPSIALSGAGPQISTQSTGRGNAGAIDVTATTLELSGGASIATNATKAAGGAISLQVGGLLYLVDSAIDTSVASGVGNGGTILIDPQFVVLSDSRIIANAAGGNGGEITIRAGEFVQSANSVVQASSQLGISGTISISTPEVSINGALVSLAGDLRAPAVIALDDCGNRAGRQRSSLSAPGHGGTIPDPDLALPALYIAGRDVAASPISAIIGAREITAATLDRATTCR
jgi:large exoprotein involved in heme utilization and adhesion